MRQLLIDTAEDVDDPGFDTRTGYGRINAYEAVLLAATSDGVVRLDAEAYGCLSAIEITVSDIDLAGAGSLTVTVRSDTETAGESVSLVETGAGAGVFEGTIAADEGPALPDGTLQVTAGDTVTAEYLDADDGHGGTDILKSDTAIVDCLAPAIFDVGTENPTDTAVDVVWSTDEPATSLVRYGTQPPPTLEASRAALTDLHDVKLGGLEECTRYLYEVQSADGQGNTAIDDNAGAFYAFETYGYYPETGPVPCHQGQVLLDRTEPYGCDDTVGVTVIDVDLDLDPGSVESVDVLLTSSSETDGEWITLTESYAG